MSSANSDTQNFACVVVVGSAVGWMTSLLKLTSSKCRKTWRVRLWDNTSVQIVRTTGGIDFAFADLRENEQNCDSQICYLNCYIESCKYMVKEVLYTSLAPTSWFASLINQFAQYGFDVVPLIQQQNETDAMYGEYLFEVSLFKAKVHSQTISSFSDELTWEVLCDIMSRGALSEEWKCVLDVFRSVVISSERFSVSSS